MVTVDLLEVYLAAEEPTIEWVGLQNQWMNIVTGCEEVVVGSSTLLKHRSDKAREKLN